MARIAYVLTQHTHIPYTLAFLEGISRNAFYMRYIEKIVVGL